MNDPKPSDTIPTTSPPERCCVCNRPAIVVVWRAKDDRFEHYCGEHRPSPAPDGAAP